jgi:hypothetical protein
MGYRAVWRTANLSARAAMMRYKLRLCGFACHITPELYDTVLQERFRNFHHRSFLPTMLILLANNAISLANPGAFRKK